MAKSRPDSTSEKLPAPRLNTGLDSASRYTVVARRYRPQTFNDVIGQDHVVQALRNAINFGRVTHAYLFSGTRGVGKTSIARIFAKCLNCVEGPTDTPCNVCDICQSISVGQDVDVIEIDGASNNGVEQVRELRQNASLRPSRSRFKIYYIDEVHMLSTGAFNALLKTLEEPPEHVKFFFATTEPNKIPITVLSRCQRYDFAGIRPEPMVEALAEICRRESVDAENDALATIARRAAGSMRDAQSLLEQLLSFDGTRITEQLVHEALGLAPTEAVLDVLDALADRDPAAALAHLDQAVASGVQPSDLLNSLLDFLRDVMVLAAGAEISLLAAPPSARARLQAVTARWPLNSILAALQILAEARGRMRGSPHGRLLVELALARSARLDDFEEISTLLARLDGLPPSTPTSLPPKKKTVPPSPPLTRQAEPKPAPPKKATPPTELNAGSPTEIPLKPLLAKDLRTETLSLEIVQKAWARITEHLGAPLGNRLGMLSPGSIIGPETVAIAVPSTHNWVADLLTAGDAPARIEAAFREIFGRRVIVRLDRGDQPHTQDANGQKSRPATRPAANRAQHEDLESDPLIQELVKLFDARPLRVDLDDEGDIT